MPPSTTSPVSDTNEDGFCYSCRKNVLTHPLLQCPWCSTPMKLAVGELELPADASPGQIMRAVTDHMKDLPEELRPIINSLTALRSAAARSALAGDVVGEARVANVAVRFIEGWAEPAPEISCSKGHKRSEYGSHDGKKWTCAACARIKAETPAPPKVAKVSDGRKRRAAWRAHEKRLARREELAAMGGLPERLNAPMPPPVLPPSVFGVAVQ